MISLGHSETERDIIMWKSGDQHLVDSNIVQQHFIVALTIMHHLYNVARWIGQTLF